jgi:mannose-6-phosphate isomerase-like protein (cupin superfamily)
LLSAIDERTMSAEKKKETGANMREKHNIWPMIMVLAILFGMLQVPHALAMSDDVIKQRIEAKAAETVRLNGTEVRVHVEKFFVVLSGTVRFYRQKMRFERIAWQTMGVAEVDNEIVVVSRVALSDAAIKDRIIEIVRTFSRFHGAGVSVTVNGGAATLRGTFGHPLDVQFLKNQVADIEGVIALEMLAALRT